MRSLFRLFAVCLLPLAGCGMLPFGKADPPERVVDEALPAARPLNAETSRTLFLIIVDGLHRDGRSRAALAYLGDYERLYPGDRQAMLLRADCLAETAQPAEASALYRTLLGSDDAAAAYAGLGRIAAAAADWPTAVTNFRHASERSAANTQFLNDLGFAQVSVGIYAEALATLRQAFELAPDTVTIRNNLILALHLSGNEAEARALIARIASPDERRRAQTLLEVTPASLRQAASGPTTTLLADTGSALARPDLAHTEARTMIVRTIGTAVLVALLAVPARAAAPDRAEQILEMQIHSRDTRPAGPGIAGREADAIYEKYVGTPDHHAAAPAAAAPPAAPGP